jgi:hypothetical protein
VFYFAHLLNPGVADDLVDGIQCLPKVLLFAEALCLKNLCLYIYILLAAIPGKLLVVPTLYVLCFVKGIDGIVIVVLGHECLG